MCILQVLKCCQKDAPWNEEVASCPKCSVLMLPVLQNSLTVSGTGIVLGFFSS